MTDFEDDTYQINSEDKFSSHNMILPTISEETASMLSREYEVSEVADVNTECKSKEKFIAIVESRNVEILLPPAPMKSESIPLAGKRSFPKMMKRQDPDAKAIVKEVLSELLISVNEEARDISEISVSPVPFTKHASFLLNPESSSSSEDTTTTGSVSDESVTDEEEKLEKECEVYLDVDRYATNVVNRILNKSLDNANVYMMAPEPEVRRGKKVGHASSENLMKIVEKWPSVEEFTSEMGISMIYTYIGNWTFEENWAYCVEFLVAESDLCSDFYLYEVKFSIPTNPYPVPQAFANVYFTVEVSRVKPKQCPVNVFYSFEGTGAIHSVQEKMCWENCLFRIIDAKLAFYKTLRF